DDSFSQGYAQNAYPWLSPCTPLACGFQPRLAATQAQYQSAMRYNFPMRYRVILLGLALLLPRTSSSAAKDPKWFEVSSEHFLLFTDTSEMKGRRLVTDLETRVGAFGQVFGAVPQRQFPIEIFLFNEDTDFLEALPRVQPPANNQNQSSSSPL